MMNKDDLLKNQYQNADKLSVRQSIYRYSTHSEPFWKWVAKHYPIQPGNKVLEVGCGNGTFWLDTFNLFPNNIQVTLTDFSEGMLKDAKKNLSSVPNIIFGIADVEHLHYANNYFDVVVSHFMLYHTDSPERALLEIMRVLKPEGFCGIVLPSKNSMKSLFSILKCEDPRQARFFSPESAIKLLPALFSQVNQHIYHDEFKIRDVDLLIDYIRSLSTMDKKNDTFYLDCKEKLNTVIKKEGYINLETDQYLFIAKK